MAELLTVVVLVLGAWLIVVMVKNRMPESSDAGTEVRSRVKVNENGLVVKERHSSLYDALEVVAAREVNFSYIPDRYVYTGATVGGIHTGGVTKLDGGYTVSSGAKTGDYYLSYKYGKYNEYNNLRWSSRYVAAVSLTKKDFSLAKTDAVLKKYIPDEQGRKNLTTGFMPPFTEEEAKTSLLLVSMTKADAEYVKNWLSTGNSSVSTGNSIKKENTATKNVKETTNPKKTKKAIICAVAVFCLLLAIICLLPDNSPKGRINQICKEYGLENAEITLKSYSNYGGYDFYSTTVSCDGFSSLDEKSIRLFFSEIYSISLDLEGVLLSEEDITIISDGHTYTIKKEMVNGKNTRIVCIDGKVMDERYDESNRITCTDCGGRGSTRCNDCDGKGKKSVKFYSEGDWGYESYSSYDCTDCDGRGRIECNRCYGEGYYYNLGE